MIRTVLGDMDIPDGPILTHEHLQIDLSHNKGADNILGPGEEGDVTADLREVAADYGLKAVADLSVVGSGRDIEALRRIARNTGLAVIAATGFYWDPLPPAVMDSTEEQLAAFMISEIEMGIGDTGIRCGTIKIGTGDGEPTAAIESLFRAAVRAAKITGASIITHTSKPSQARWQLDVLDADGMDLSHVLISHLHKLQDVAEIIRIAASGAFIGIDQLGFKKGPSLEYIAELVTELIGLGLGKQLIFSADIARKSRLIGNGGHGYATTFSKFLPLLRSRGVSGAQIEQIMADNPRTVLALCR